MYLRINEQDRVTAIYRNERNGCLEVNDIPSPEKREGYLPVMYYRNGKVEYEYIPLPDEKAVKAMMEGSV